MNPLPCPRSLDGWLQYIQGLHPAEIAPGLERVSKAAAELGLTRPAAKVITVAGTNGKGSCVHTMERVLLGQGRRVAAYTSPHLLRFNERIRMDGREAADRALCRAFAEVERARRGAGVTLSFFEFTTLGALLLFRGFKAEVALLEVGLGGRLDAVNMVAADVAVITSIALDHQQWLGADLEAIGREKAGILRRGRPLVLGGGDMPDSVLAAAARLDCPVYRMAPPRGDPLAANQAAALQALLLAGFHLDGDRVRQVVTGPPLAGRFEERLGGEGVSVILDVAHNPAACRLCAENLKKWVRVADSGRCIAVLAVAADKDIEGMLRALEPVLDVCYIAAFDWHRHIPAAEAAARCRRTLPGLDVRPVEGGVVAAYQTALAECGPGDVLLVTGSFMTVGAVRPLTVPLAENTKVEI